MRKKCIDKNEKGEDKYQEMKQSGRDEQNKMMVETSQEIFSESLKHLFFISVHSAGK